MDLTRLLKTSRSNAGGRRQYWEDAAKKVGLADSSQGVRFARRPGAGPDYCMSYPMEEQSLPLVLSSDKPIVTDFLFLLMEQMERCRFTEEDRIGGRSKVKDYPVGFPGMQCKHCRGKAGFGRYFPSSANALALANSDRNIYNHIRKCRRCPESIKHELQYLQVQQTEEGSKNKRGSRKQFFSSVWERMNREI